MALVAWDDDAASANSYVTRAAADTYFTDTTRNATWSGYSTANREAALVEVTRMLDRQTWAGDKASSSQPLEWPRSGVTDKNGTTVADDDIPTAIRQATYELAYAVLGDATVQTQTANSSNAKRVKAGSAEVEFWRREGTSRFPTIVQELVRQFFGGGGIGAAVAYGAGDPDEAGVSEFADGDKYGVTEGY